MLRVSSIPIRGVAILFGKEPSLAEASLRLSPEHHDLVRIIVNQIEHEVMDSDSH
jgi:hypothetical protein